jgi:integrase
MKTDEAIELFLKSRKARGLSEQSVRWYQGILSKFNNIYSRLPEKPDAIYDFLSKCQAGDERLHGYYRTLRVFYNFICRYYDLKNPIDKVDPPKRRPKRPRPLTPEELDQLLSYPHNAKIKAALIFLTDTGARVGELTDLTPSDISNTQYGYIVKISGKTGVRYVPICHETYIALIQVLPFGYTAYRLRRLISQAFTDANVQGSGINLRHTFGTLWRGDELVLQRIMGHSHLSTTMIYRALRTELMSEQHEMYSPLKMILGSSKRML